MRHLVLTMLVPLAACAPHEPDPRGVGRDETLLTVSATGRAEATPDQALFTAGLSTTAVSAQAASTLNARRMNGIVAALAKLHVPVKDIQTQNLSLDRVGLPHKKVGYQTNNTLSVRVRDVKQVGAAIAAVTAAGANIISGPNLSVADPERANLSAYGAAYRAARAKAQAYADAAGLRIARPLTIRDGGEGGAMPMAGMAEERAADARAQLAAPPPVLAGTNSNTVTVTIEFALAPK